eukprot:2662676-Prymnesium_polylepis.1
MAFGDGVYVGTATLNGLLLGGRWALEGFGAPFIGRMIDQVGWDMVAPVAFGLSCANGSVGFLLLLVAESAGPEASSVLLTSIL